MFSVYDASEEKKKVRTEEVDGFALDDGGVRHVGREVGHDALDRHDWQKISEESIR